MEKNQAEKFDKLQLGDKRFRGRVIMVVALTLSVLMIGASAKAQLWFGAAANRPCAPYATTLAATDANTDGHFDVIVGSSGFDSIAVYLGDGNGSFALLPVISWVGVGGEYMNAGHLVSGDLSGDGIPDVVKAHGTVCDTVSVLFGNGDGSFQLAANLPSGIGPIDPVVADIDADGDQDLVVACAGSDAGGYLDGSVVVFSNDGSGGLVRSVVYPTAAPSGPFAVALNDIDHDGDLDLAVAYKGSGCVQMRYNDGLGNFDAVGATVAVGTLGSNPSDVEFSDFNSDGHEDLCVALSEEGSVAIAIGNGDGTFADPSYALPQSRPYRALCADLDGNGLPDIVTADHWSSTISIIENLGTGQFQVHETCMTEPFPHAVCIADLDENGRKDLMAASTQPGSGTLSVFLNANSLCTEPDLPAAIVYALGSDGGWALWKMMPDGSSKTRIMNIGANRPAGIRISPSGHEIAFGADRDGTFDVYVVSSDGYEIQRVTTGGCRGVLDWESESSLLYLTSDWRIARIDVVGSGMEVISPIDGYDYAEAALSPDRSEIVYGKNLPGYSANRKVYCANYPGFTHERLVLDNSGDSGLDAPHDWGCKNLVVAQTQTSEIDNIYVVRPNGTFPVNLTPTAEVHDLLARFSLDAAQLAVLSDQSGSNQIWAMNLDGTGRTQLTNYGGSQLIGDFDWGSLPFEVRGDADGSGTISVSDAVFLIYYIFAGGPAPVSTVAGDANSDCSTNITDCVFLINYIFSGGPAPSADLSCDGMQWSKRITFCGANVRAIDFLGCAMVTLDASAETQAVQLHFVATNEVSDVEVQCSDPRFQVFSGWVDGEYRVGVIDLTGKTTLPAGTHDLLTISYEGDGELVLTSAIVVDSDAREMATTISSAKVERVLPTEFALKQNRPNPFNPSTEISFCLPKPAEVTLAIYNILGESVATLAEGLRTAGTHAETWDGRDKIGRVVASGVYFYRLDAGEFSATRKMLLLK